MKLVVRRLRQSRFDVRAVEAAPGVEDSFVLATARAERRVLLTNDKDFTELVFRRKQASFGILLLRLGRWNSERKADRLMEVLRDQPSLRGALMVVRPRDVRRRTFDDPG